jgi:hypothetical protein
MAVIKKKDIVSNKYKILEEYIYSGKSNREIGIKLGLAEKTIENVIGRLYKDFCAVRETKSLICEATLPLNYKSEVLNTNHINDSFLEKLSEPDSPTLSDNELLFAELYNQDHDEVGAIETSKLNVGIRKDSKDTNGYKNALHLRGLYLRKKPNVAAYLNQLQKEKLSILKDGKVFLQSELLSVIGKLKKMDGERATANYLKSIETLGRILGAFDDKITIDSVNGDSVLDKILQKAKKAKAEIIEEGDDDYNSEGTEGVLEGSTRD